MLSALGHGRSPRAGPVCRGGGGGEGRSRRSKEGADEGRGPVHPPALRLPPKTVPYLRPTDLIPRHTALLGTFWGGGGGGSGGGTSPSVPPPLRRSDTEALCQTPPPQVHKARPERRHPPPPAAGAVRQRVRSVAVRACGVRGRRLLEERRMALGDEGPPPQEFCLTTQHLRGGGGGGGGSDTPPPPRTPPPLKCLGKFFSGSSANQKISLAPSAQVSLGQTISSAPLTPPTPPPPL